MNPRRTLCFRALRQCVYRWYKSGSGTLTRTGNVCFAKCEIYRKGERKIAISFPRRPSDVSCSDSKEAPLRQATKCCVLRNSSKLSQPRERARLPLERPLVEEQSPPPPGRKRRKTSKRTRVHKKEFQEEFLKPRERHVRKTREGWEGLIKRRRPGSWVPSLCSISRKIGTRQASCFRRRG